MATAQKNSRILIVDDDAAIRGLMARQFRRAGYEVEQAEAAEEAIARFGDVPRFDVVVTDVHLPGQSGVDLARRIKEMEPEQQVVFMTGDADAAIARQALKNGAAGFLLKPFEFFEIDTAVRNAVQRKTAHVTVPAKVVLGPARRRRPRRLAQVRVAAIVAVMITLGWLAGVGLAPAPVSGVAPAEPASLQPDNRPTVVPIVIERSVYLK